MAAEITIIKGVPRPSRKKSESRYPFRKMAVGDHFLFPPGYRITSAASMASRAPKLVGGKAKFCVHELPNGRLGCWRIK